MTWATSERQYKLITLLYAARNVAILVLGTAIVSWLISTKPDLPWAQMSEFHVQFNSFGRHEVQISLQFEKHQQCRRVVVLAQASLLQDNSVLPGGIALVSTLGDRMHDAPIGKTALFALATSEIPLHPTSPDAKPNQYQVTVVATCELDKPGTGLATAPVRSILVAPPDTPRGAVP